MNRTILHLHDVLDTAGSVQTLFADNADKFDIVGTLAEVLGAVCGDAPYSVCSAKPPFRLDVIRFLKEFKIYRDFTAHLRAGAGTGWLIRVAELDVQLCLDPVGCRTCPFSEELKNAG
jgi:hypothetical protein